MYAIVHSLSVRCCPIWVWRNPKTVILLRRVVTDGLPCRCDTHACFRFYLLFVLGTPTYTVPGLVSTSIAFLADGCAPLAWSVASAFVSMGIPDCDDKLKLLVEYQRLNHAYTTALGKMAVHELSGADYARLRAAVASAKLASAEARRVLDRHIAEHGC